MRSLAISGYVFSIFIAASLAACGGASHSITQAALPASRVPTRPPTGGAEFLYVADGNSFWPATGAIGAFTLENGFLEQLQDSPYRAYTPAGLAADPVANYLYASSKAKGIYGYYVDPYTGALSLIAGSPFGGPEGPITVAPNGAFLYATFSSGSAGTSITAYSIDSITGALSEASETPSSGGAKSIAITPSGAFLYVAGGGSGEGKGIWGYSVSPSNGGLIPIPRSPFAQNADGSVAVAPSGNFLYDSAVSDGSAYGIGAYAINSSSGALRETSGSPYGASELGYAGLAISPSGDLAYAPNGRGIDAFYVHQRNGALAQVPGSPFSGSISYPEVDSSGEFLYGTTAASNGITGFKINTKNGHLLPGKFTGVGVRPTWIVVTSAHGSSPCPCLYVVNDTSVTVYPSGASGNVQALREISGANTELNQPYDLAVDGSGNVYVANQAGGTVPGSVTVYAAGATGNVTPEQTIIGSNTMLNTPQGVAIDPLNGDIYVTNADDAITVYAAGSNGNVWPIGVIQGSQTGLDGPGRLALDPSGNIYVANASTKSITVYAAGSTGNIKPMRTIKGNLTKLSDPVAVALDSSLNVYVANFNHNLLTVYAAGANGNVAPIQVIYGHPLTKLGHPSGIAVDSGDNLYAANYNNSITVYAAGSNGNVAPIRKIKGSRTQLANPMGILIH